MSNRHITMAFSMPTNANETLVLICLANKADDMGLCFPSYTTLMAETKLAKATLAKSLHILEGAGLIERKSHGSIGTGKKVNTYKMLFDESWFVKSSISSSIELAISIRIELIEKINNLRASKRQPISSALELRKVQRLNSISSTPEHEPPYNPHSESPLIKINKSDISKSKKAEDETNRNPAEEIFNFWQTTMNHPQAVFDSKRKAIITRALKSYTVDQLKSAIAGCSKSSWHMGQNDKSKVYDSLDLIFRNADKIESFIQNSTINPPHGVTAHANKHQRSTAIAGQIFGAAALVHDAQRASTRGDGYPVSANDGYLLPALD
ncbi:helix-turn-helix domain-containing protein [Methylomonas sp. HYX-M1]|uniref:helix-turn-helix domain-containing protein n=1 Tax=Methylomonas sp. HYX-M1 TaxID=3139307 RepID=UPI00345BEAC2